MDINQNNTYGNNAVIFGSVARKISLESENLFIEELKKTSFKNKEFSIRTYFGDAECQNLSYQIKSSFEKAGWKIKEYAFVIPDKPVVNLALGVPESEKGGSTSIAIYNWLNKNSLKVAAELVKDEMGYIIFVGQNL